MISLRQLLAIHTSNQPQFYPECAQLVVTGSGSAQPSGSSLVMFPGAYKAYVLHNLVLCNCGAHNTTFSGLTPVSPSIFTQTPLSLPTPFPDLPYGTDEHGE